MKNRDKCVRLPLIFCSGSNQREEKKKRKGKKERKKKQSWTILFAQAEKNAGGGICQDDIRGVMQLIGGQEPCVAGSYAACI